VIKRTELRVIFIVRVLLYICMVVSHESCESIESLIRVAEHPEFGSIRVSELNLATTRVR
jgi:hypothetical protein